MAPRPPNPADDGAWPEIVLRKDAFKRLARHDPQLLHFQGDSCPAHVLGEPNLSAISRCVGVYRSTLNEIALGNQRAGIDVISRLTHLRTRQLGVDWHEALADLCDMTNATQPAAVAA